MVQKLNFENGADRMENGAFHKGLLQYAEIVPVSYRSAGSQPFGPFPMATVISSEPVQQGNLVCL